MRFISVHYRLGGIPVIIEGFVENGEVGKATRARSFTKSSNPLLEAKRLPDRSENPAEICRRRYISFIAPCA